MTVSRKPGPPARGRLCSGAAPSLAPVRGSLAGRASPRATAAALVRRFCITAAVGYLIGVPLARAEPAIARRPTSAAAVDRFAFIVTEASHRFGIPEAWIGAVIRIESGGQPRALSPKGAMGLMQLMPQTWADLRARYGLGADPYDPHDNIIAGSAYLRELHDRYGVSGFLAAYNAGPARYESLLATGRTLPAETRAYLVRLAPLMDSGALGQVGGWVGRARSWVAAPLFYVRAGTHSTRQPDPAGSPTHGRRAEPWARRSSLSDSLFVGSSARSPAP